MGIGKNILICTGATFFVRGRGEKVRLEKIVKKTGPSTCISYLWSKKTMESVKCDEGKSGNDGPQRCSPLLLGFCLWGEEENEKDR